MYDGVPMDHWGNNGSCWGIFWRNSKNRDKSHNQVNSVFSHFVLFIVIYVLSQRLGSTTIKGIELQSLGIEKNLEIWFIFFVPEIMLAKEEKPGYKNFIHNLWKLDS